MLPPFLTYDEQIDKLIKQKKLIIIDRELALNTLKNIGYFPVIGGYKTPFINPMTRVYENDTEFSDILYLYNFDQDLRNIFFKTLCMLELRMRQVISYCFCKKHGEDQKEYLNPHNFDCSTKYKSKNVLKLINIFSYLAEKNNEHQYIVHQRKIHKNVPLWVLMKALTFGQTSRMYSLSKFEMKKDICKEFINVSETAIETYLERLCLIRNTCAHNERLYCFHFDKDFPDTKLHERLRIHKKGEQYIYGKNDLFAAVIALRYLLPKENFIIFKKELTQCIEKYLSKSNRMNRNKLYKYMGFPKNWTDITKYKI